MTSTTKALLRACRRDPLLTIANTPMALLVSILGTLTLSGVLFAWLEDHTVANGLWWAVVTMTTTGYGDFAPHTGAGRCLGAGLMLWSIFFLLPAAIYHIAERLIQDKDEWTHEEQEQLRKDVSEIKAMVSHIAGSDAVNR